MPVTMPAPDTEAIVPLPEVHAPPAAVLLSVAERPMQTDDAPLMGAGSGLTVITVATVQPVPSE